MAYAARSFLPNVWSRSLLALEDEFDANPRRPAVPFVRRVERSGGRLVEWRMWHKGKGAQLDLDIRLYG
jgi:hypothetical protein